MKTIKCLVDATTDGEKERATLEVTDFIPETANEIQQFTDLRRKIKVETISAGRTKVTGCRTQIALEGPGSGSALYPLANSSGLRAISQQALVVLANRADLGGVQSGEAYLAAFFDHIDSAWVERRHGLTTLYLLSRDRRRELVISSRQAKTIEGLVAFMLIASERRSVSVPECAVSLNEGGNEIVVRTNPRAHQLPVGASLNPHELANLERLLVTVATLSEGLELCVRYSLYLRGAGVR